MKLLDVKRSPSRAQEIEQRLAALPGVHQAFVNPLTGNALVHYDADRIEAATIVATLHSWGHLRAPTSSTVHPDMDDWSATLLRVAAEMAIQRVLRALLVP